MDLREYVKIYEIVKAQLILEKYDILTTNQKNRNDTEIDDEKNKIKAKPKNKGKKYDMD